MVTVDHCPDETAVQLREYVRSHPDIRHDDYRDAENPVRESCYVLSEAYFHANGGEDGPFEVYRIGWGDIYPDGEGAHWFLRDSDRVVDLSLPSPEFGANVPWDEARHRAFITGYTPSERTQRLLRGIGREDVLVEVA